MFKLFNIFNSKRTVSIQLDRNVQLTVTPTAGGVHAVLTEDTGMFRRQEKAFFATLEDLTRSLRISDESIARKLSKAF